jgi:hypothetical protein
VPIERPPLLCLGGAEAFRAYQAAFDDRYHAKPVIDVRGCLVEFPADSCRHICFKDGLWVQERAERILWAYVALTHPETKVRENWDRRDRLSYYFAIGAAGSAQEYFGVVVDPRGKRKMEFVTAFPFEHVYWQKWERGGKLLYPPQEPAAKKKRR